MFFGDKYGKKLIDTAIKTRIDAAKAASKRVVQRHQKKVYDQSDGTYSISKLIRFKTSMLRSDLCDYSDAYIVIKGTIPVEGANDTEKHN